MGQLKEQLAVPRTLADGSVLETIHTTASTSGLLLVKMHNKQYALSWAYFSSAEYFAATSGDDGTTDERIEMEFLHRRVTLHGRNLEKLMDGITQMSIARVHESPERYLATEYVRDMGGEIVTRIDIEKRG